MLSENLISIIMPVYNAASVLPDTLDAIINQTHSHWELIVVDDFSLDESFPLLESYSARDKRIKCFRNQMNMGSPLTRNEALQHAKGNFIAFCDADDLFMPNKLEKQISFMREKKVAFTYGWYRRISADLKRTGHLIKGPVIMTYNKLLSDSAICTSTVMIDRTIISDLTMADHHMHDFLLWLRILKEDVSKAVCVEHDLLRYRVINKSFSSDKKKMVYNRFKCYSEMLNLSFLKKMHSMFGYAYNSLKKYSRF